MDKVYVMDVLVRNGISDEYLDRNGDEVELGSEEWMDVVSEIVGKDSYVDELSDEDNRKIEEFMRIMREDWWISFY
jgi:hypothetical protein